MQKIAIALLLHMHQPYYRDPYTGKFNLPWVRLHGLKDYYGMAAILDRFPAISATFNLVPSLISQLESYISGDTDLFLDLFKKDASTLKTEEIHFLVRHFFSANEKHLIAPFSRYQVLLEKKNRSTLPGFTPWEKIFTIDELRDLQVLFQLCYFDEEYKIHDSRITSLIKKGRLFTEADKIPILEAQTQLLAEIIPTYKRLCEKEQIEISTTPFYHPILPLLLNPQDGRTANPHLPVYDLHFSWPQDARYQLESALDFMEAKFGKRPVGIWPSEGSLSMGVLDIMEQLGITWTATDEANLAKSLGIAFERDEHMDIKHPEILYKPYQIKGKPLSLFFRDHYLSDLIGFHYQSVPAKKAAQDFVQRIKRIRITSNTTPVVPIILDGENAWEYYPESGREFLSEFFRLVTNDEQLETITFSQASKMERGIIPNLQTGSWINGNFDIWIGHEEDRKAWKWIERAKEAVLKREKDLSQEKKEKIREYLSIAQGSDWFWWFGAENFTPDLDIFDDLFRKNVQKLFELSGNDVPYELTVPIAHRIANDTGNIVLPARKISPSIDGKSSGYFEWLYAGYIDTRAFGGAMNISNPIMKRVYFGFSDIELFLKIEAENSPAHYFENDYQLEIRLQKVELDRTTLINRFVFPDKGNNCGMPSYRFAAENHIEIALSLKELQVREGDSFKIRFHWKYKGELFLEVPRHDYLLLHVPTQRDYAAFWMV